MFGFDFRQGQVHRLRRAAPAPRALFVHGDLSLNKDALVPRAIQAIGAIRANPILGGLHHRYVRI